MKPWRVFKIAICAFVLSGCSIGAAETQTAAETQNEIKIESASNQPQANKNPSAKVNRTANAVCGDPAKPCQHRQKEFARWELSFELPAKIVANKTYSSAPFYAVLLKTYVSNEDCDGGEYVAAIERERKKLQTKQSARKVFALYGCPNMDAVGYDFEGLWDTARERILINHFIAVYAGETKNEAEVLRRQLLAEYPDAAIKKMTATWERIVQ